MTEPVDGGADAVAGAAADTADDVAWRRTALRLPDGAWVRGRSVRRPLPDGPEPTLGVYLGVDHAPGWLTWRVDWPDFRLPREDLACLRVLRAAHRRALAGERVELGCAGGMGRTGTALAAIAVLAGVEAPDAVAWVREHYHRHAVETPWQRRWVRRVPDLVARLDGG